MTIFILTHGRAGNVKTLNTLRNQGFNGRIILLLDNTDKQIEEYRKLYKDVEIEIFNKLEIANKIDDYHMDKSNLKSIIYARNATFYVAKKLGIKYFIQLDDDYTNFNFRFNSKLEYKYKTIKNINKAFNLLLDIFKSMPDRVITLCIAQGGDFIGGKENKYAKKISFYRKAMNSFICSTDRFFEFKGRINEDVNIYTRENFLGNLLFTFNFFSLQQMQTQQNGGGMTDIYLDKGTYVKSFYSIISMPSAVTIKEMGSSYKRLHHSISWDNVTPLILREDIKKNK